MYYAGTRLLHPISRYNAEYNIPETADLRGLCYDYSDHTVVTYDRVEKKLLWIDRSNSFIIASAMVGSPVDDVISMCQFDNFIYILNYDGDGHMSVCTGSLQQARSTGVLDVTQFEVPYSTPSHSGKTIWDLTHAASPYWLRYHPDFSSIFNIGSQVYLVIGLANTVTPGVIPPELGQYVVEFELSGLFRNPIKIDHSGSIIKKASIDGLNGLTMAATYHDNVLLCLARSIEDIQPNVLHQVQMQPGLTLKIDTTWYVAGKLNYGASLVVGGRWLYALIANRIYKSEIIMIKMAMETGWPNTQCVDLGTLASGQATFRRLRAQNVSPAYTYHDMVVSSANAGLTLSLESSTDRNDYADRIHIPQALAPGDTFEFYICLRAPIVTSTDFSPVQYHEYITFVPSAVQQ